MPAHFNSSYRVHRLLTKASQQDASASALTAWARTFDLRDGASIQKSIQVARLVGLLYEETELALAQMRSTAFSKELYDGAFASAKAALNVDQLNAQWNNWRQHLRPEVLHAIRFCSELIPEQEHAIAEDDLTDLVQRLDNLWKAVEESDLSDALKKFIFDQISILDAAIREYPVTGARAFRRAMLEASLAYSENESVVQDGEQAEQVQALTGVWKLVAAVTHRVEVVQKLLGAGSKLVETGADIAGQVDKLV